MAHSNGPTNSPGTGGLMDSSTVAGLSDSGPAVGFDQEAAAINTIRVFYGLLREPELAHVNLPDEDDDRSGPSGAMGNASASGTNLDDTIDGSSMAAGEGSLSQQAQAAQNKKKKFKKDKFLNKKLRNDPNAPGLTRIALPEIRDTEKVDRLIALKEGTKRLTIGPDSLPSVCFYTFLNAQQVNQTAVLCAEISEDTRMVAAGLADSTVRVWSLTLSQLTGLRSASDLDNLDKESDDVYQRMMTSTGGQGYTKVLCGHSGPVFGINFSPDKTLLLSCSEDATIRLWSLLTWTNICCYKGHCYPIWDVKFSPLGYYFATVSHDKTARLWGTDSHQPLRIFVGHTDDVDIVQWHHNCNYLATGSSDKTVRLWDLLDGRCVRLLIGHHGKISSLLFSPCGRFLLSGSTDERIILWDIPTASQFVTLAGVHVDTVYSLSFSRCGSVLVSGGADDQVVLWDYARLQDEHDIDYAGLSASVVGGAGGLSVSTQSESLVLAAYRTKTTSVMALHFTRRNLLIAAGVFH